MEYANFSALEFYRAAEAVREIEYHEGRWLRAWRALRREDAGTHRRCAPREGQPPTPGRLAGAAG
jgi:hypothetical protein